MKIFAGYHCEECGADFDVDSRTLKEKYIYHTDPECPVCGCDDMIKHVYVDDKEEE